LAPRCTVEFRPMTVGCQDRDLAGGRANLVMLPPHSWTGSDAARAAWRSLTSSGSQGSTIERHNAHIDSRDGLARLRSHYGQNTSAIESTAQCGPHSGDTQWKCQISTRLVALIPAQFQALFCDDTVTQELAAALRQSAELNRRFGDKQYDLILVGAEGPQSDQSLWTERWSMN
jgi:hypothetical protein